MDAKESFLLKQEAKASDYLSKARKRLLGALVETEQAVGAVANEPGLDDTWSDLDGLRSALAKSCRVAKEIQETRFPL